MGKRTRPEWFEQRLLEDSMIIKYRQDVLVSIESQSEEIVTIYIYIYILITIEHRNNFDYYNVLSFFFFFSSLLFYEESFILYILLWIIFTLHLLIIRALTWILVTLDTLSGFLWVVVVEVVLFRGLLHINAARKVAAVHLMQWWQLSLRYF